MAYYLSPIRRMANMNKVMDRMFDDFRTKSSYGNSTVQIPLNVEVDDDAYEITALVPGLASEDVNIQVLDDTITISGELKAEESDETKSLLHEIPTGSFRRVIRVPLALNPEQAEAAIKDGILRLRVPKAETARPKTIEVKVS
jgi:HSP20 family protein